LGPPILAGLVIAALSCSLTKSKSDFSATFFFVCFPFAALLPMKEKGSALMFREEEEGAGWIVVVIALEIGCGGAREVLEKVTDVVEEDGGCEDVLGVLGGDWVVAGDCSETVWIHLVEEVELSFWGREHWAHVKLGSRWLE
jgi:hypothetical protein